MVRQAHADGKPGALVQLPGVPGLASGFGAAGWAAIAFSEDYVYALGGGNDVIDLNANTIATVSFAPRL